MRVRYGKPIKVTSLLKNSDFKNDSYTGWVSYRQTTTVYNGIATCTRTTGTYGTLYQDVSNLPGTHIYFYYVKMMALDNTITRINLTVNTSPTFYAKQDNPNVNDWYEFYGVSNVNNTSLRFEPQCACPENSGARYKFTTPIIIDLTNSFGSGK